MLPEFKEGRRILTHMMTLQGFNSKYQEKKLMMKTSLYSVYLVSAKEQTMANDEVLLVEHLPAKEPSAHLLPVTINESGTLFETSEEVVHAHFAQKDESFLQNKRYFTSS